LLLEKADEVLAVEMDGRLVEFLCERFGLTTQADELPALTPALSPEERENVEDAIANPTLPDSSQRSNDKLPLPGERVGGRADPPAAGNNLKQNLFLLHADALGFLKREQRDWRDWKLVANLPYSVASPILVELSAGTRAPKMMVVTLQLEVAQRLMAPADDDHYGILTLLVQLDFAPRDWFKIPPGCFFPSPDVDSACVILERRPQPLLPEELRVSFVKIVKRAFSQRRKMMMKLLKQDWAVDKLTAAFAELNISPMERAEKLSLEQFVGLTKLLT